MRGKIILLFILSLIALSAIGFMGQRGLREMIVSIEEASAPNAKIAGLNEIMQSLSDAESSVRSFIITRDQQTLAPFKNSAATIDIKLAQLYRITSDSAQQVRLERLDDLITRKYETLSDLINVRDETDGNVLRKVMDDIDKLKSAAEATEESREEQQDPSVFSRLFGEEPAPEDSVAMDPNISSRELNEAIDRIGREETAASMQLMQKELQLTQQDNVIMNRIRGVMEEIEQAEIQLSSSRTASVRETSEKTINTITTVLVITLFVFAFLLSVIFNDIRKNRRNREQLRMAKEKAEKLARVKEEFLSNMSHEIRTPLNAIIGYTEQLEDTALDHRQSKHLSRIRSSGDHLLRLINDILDYAKMESGKMSLEESGFRPELELEEVASLFSPTVDKKGLSLESTVGPDVPSILIGDSVRFRQILINLLNNAIKFTDEGGISITLGAKSLNETEYVLTLSVKDSGIGIPGDKLASIFDDFSQADSSTARKYGGSGLGLSIVNKLARLHHGEVTVESEEDSGTTFHVTLRYRKGEIHHLPKEETPKDADLSGLRVLVVDDQPFNLELLELLLTKWEMTCEVCADGNTALKKIEQHKFDLILMDIQMPGMSGLELSRKITSENLVDADIPIVALTAGTGAEDRKKAREAGMKFFLAKPFTQVQLKDIIIKACGIYAIPSSQPAMPKDKGDEVTMLKLDGLLELANGDLQFVTNMLSIFRNNFLNDLGDLNKAVKGKDWNKVKSVAHKMSPPCGHLGFSQVAKILKNMERMASNAPSENAIASALDEIQNKSSSVIAEIDHKISELDPNKQHV